MKSDLLERLWKLQTSANELLLQGKREPDSYIEFLQKFVFGNILPDIDWQKVYEALGMSAEYATAIEKLGVRLDQTFWFVPVVNGVTCKMVVDALRSVNVAVTCYIDFENDSITSDRQLIYEGSYNIGFRRTVEADEENAGKSANMLKAENHKGITLLERLLLELGYFLTTGQNLDVANITLCSGSRDSYSSVPGVDFDYGKVHVDWYDPGRSYDVWRSRSAVPNIPPA